MFACIPTEGKTGIDDTVFGHFGSAPYFTLYDSETDQITVIENRNAHHSHGTCHPMNQLVKYHIDGVVCSGMGRRAIEALNSEGIKIYHSASDKVSEVIMRIKSGDLTEMDPARACRGHGQTAAMGGHGFCSHGHDATSGRGSGFGPGLGRRSQPADDQEETED